MFSGASQYVRQIQYTVHSDTNQRIHTGFSLNINNPWLCLYTSDNRLRIGQELLLQNLQQEASRKAVVRWVEKFESYYFVILDYLKETPGDVSSAGS